jgi:hypothetical protein
MGGKFRHWTALLIVACSLKIWRRPDLVGAAGVLCVVFPSPKLAHKGSVIESITRELTRCPAGDSVASSTR